MLGKRIAWSARLWRSACQAATACWDDIEPARLPAAKRVRDGGVVVDEVQREAAAGQPRAVEREGRPRLPLEAQHAHVEAARARVPTLCGMVS